MKIAKLELENVKRVKAVTITPAQSGLTVIGGRNGQGKTSVLDAIAWALGGEKYRPSSPHREGSVIPPRLHVALDNGIVIDRTGENSALKVTDPSGKKAGQALLDSFVEKLALDLPRFMAQSDREKASTLLRIIGVEEEVKRLDDQEKQLYNRRHALGQIADQKEKYANEMPYFPGAPEAPVSAGELIDRQQKILLKNAENQRKRTNLSALTMKRAQLADEMKRLQAALDQVESDIAIAETDAQTLQDESTAELEASIYQVDEINRKVRANLDNERAAEDARDIRKQYGALTQQLDAIRDQRAALLQGARLPLPELTVEDGALQYRGMQWDCMSGAEQMRVSVAIVQAINPECKFVLLDKLEAFDADALAEFGLWLEQQGLQAICTRVSTGGECEIIIEDGQIVDTIPAEQPKKMQWTEGKF